MKRLFTNLFLLVALIATTNLGAQNLRYFDPIFSSVTVKTNVVYGLNATILGYSIPGVGKPIKQPLALDLYTPDGDTETARPVILYFHTGNFLPFPQAGSPSGTKSDSTCVDFCTKLAKRGYVVASVDYRLGWAPTNPDKQTRVFSLINAAYRGVQDARTCVRFFRKTAAELGNPYGIDPDKIVMWGQGTGGYITLNTTALDNYIKIPTASDGKFIANVGGNNIPMVIEPINGDIYGTSVGVVPPGFIPPFNAGDTLCFPNHVGYSSDFNLSVNMGGAMADTAWMDPGQAPIISIHAPYDPFAPYKEGIVLVPVNPPLDVVEVQGSFVCVDFANKLGNNDAFLNKSFNDPISAVALSRAGFNGLFPIIGDAGTFDSSPYDFWASTNVNNAAGLQTNPTMSATKARSYIDSIITFVLPRACYVLDLGCKGVLTNTTLLSSEVGMKYGPNPMTNQMNITTNDKSPMKSVYVYDMSGRLVKADVKINNNQHTMSRGNLVTGVYTMTVHFDNGIVSQQIVVK